MEFQCIIHQMKGIIFLYLLIYLTLKININVKVNIRKCYFFDIYFSIVHISSNNVLDSLNFCRHVGNIGLEGTVSQIIFLNPAFLFYAKKRVTFYTFFLNIFSRFSKTQTRTYINILRHSSLDSDVLNVHAKFQVYSFYN